MYYTHELLFEINKLVINVVITQITTDKVYPAARFIDNTKYITMCVLCYNTTI